MIKVWNVLREMDLLVFSGSLFHSMEEKASWSQEVFLTCLPLRDLQLEAISRIQPLSKSYDYGVNL